MEQQTLDDAYDQAKYAPNLPQLLKRYRWKTHANQTLWIVPRSGRTPVGPLATARTILALLS